MSSPFATHAAFSIRGEVRDFWSGAPDFLLADTGKTRQHNYFVGGGMTLAFLTVLYTGSGN